MGDKEEKARSRKIIAEAIFDQECARMDYNAAMKRLDRIIKEVERDAERMESAGSCDKVHTPG